MNDPHRLYRLGLLTCTAAAMVACSSGADNAQTGEPPASSASESETALIPEPLAITYDGGLLILNGETLEVAKDIALDGFLRVNPAGDEGHLLVTTDDGFRILDAAGGQLTDETFPAAKPGHVVPHGENTVLFADGSGEITAFDPHALEGGGIPETQSFKLPKRIMAWRSFSETERWCTAWATPTIAPARLRYKVIERSRVARTAPDCTVSPWSPTRS
ncbi:MAG: hypothetical protein ACSLE3_14670 [Microbacteriaceae bacterium]